ncbi:uncharacterized protein LOC127844039 [Dreissena polymorpha]|uniref:uncharacterized protein LOC127844039 n=1 Tax=Dreissena polymorpha TaxID=45954 RepID=UPI0022649177|nr:uncharacterized protein LOC127844039 [Dreissena polymorpha]
MSDMCMSFMYNMSSNQCRLNSAKMTVVQTGCQDGLKFGQISELPFTTSTLDSTVCEPSTPSQAYIGENCSSDLDCLDPSSQCRNMECMCINAYVADHNAKKCVLITDCPSYGQLFVQINDYNYAPAPDNDIALSSVDECMSACVLASFICKLAVFDIVASRCLLHSVLQAPSIVSSNYATQSGLVLLERECSSPEMWPLCSYDSDCWVPYSNCFHGVCKCLPFFSYDPAKRRCVPECHLYSDIYTRYFDMGITNYVIRQQFSSISDEHCKQSCTEATTFECKNALYTNVENTCYMSEYSLSNLPESSLTNEPGSIILQRDCKSTTSTIENTLCFITGCPVQNSECRDGRCKCVKGYKYSAGDNMCVATCQQGLGVTFQTIKGMASYNSPDDTFTAVTSEPAIECQILCAKYIDFVCYFVILNETTHVCWLYKKDYLEIQNEAIPKPSYTTFIRDCK